jgi:SAM-dependent methyltransferase
MRFSTKSLLTQVLLLASLSIVFPGCVLAKQPPQGGATAVSQSPEPADKPNQQPSDAIQRATSKPYSGSLSTFEDPKRDEKLQVNRVMDLLGIKEGSSVADIGAGSGWFSVRAARRAGVGGTIYAVDINKAFLKHIEKRAKKENLPNIHPLLSKPDDPLLPNQSVDAVLILNTYHEIAQPVRLLKRIRQAMRAGARLGIIDSDGKGNDHGVEESVVVKEAEQAGFVLVDRHDFVKPDDHDYFLIFRVQVSTTTR